MSALWLGIFLLFAFILGIQYKSYDYNHRNISIKKLTLHCDNTDIISFCLIISFSLLCATRSETTYDTEVYKNWYLKVIYYPINRIEGSYGLFYELLSRFLGLFFRTNFRLYLFAIPLVNNMIVYNVCRKTEGIGTAGYLLYVFFIGFFYNYTVLRQSFALTLVIWAFASWGNKKKLYILLILAALFHNTAIVVLLLAILVHFIQLGKKALVVVWGLATSNYIYPITERVLGGLISSLERFIPNSMTGRYELYFFRDYSSRSFSIYYLLYYFLVLVLILWLYNDNQKRGPFSFGRSYTTNPESLFSSIIETDKIESRRMLNIGVAGLVVLSLGASFTIVIRVADYAILPCIVFLMPMYLRKKSRLTAKLYVFALCMIALALYLRIYLSQSPLYFSI